MAKKKELLALDTPRRRSKRLMKLKADDDQLEEFQQPAPSSSTDLPSSYEKSDAGNGSDKLEALAKDVFKNMRSLLVDSSGDVSKPVEQQTEMLLLETAPCKRIQM